MMTRWMPYQIYNVFISRTFSTTFPYTFSWWIHPLNFSKENKLNCWHKCSHKALRIKLIERKNLKNRKIIFDDWFVLALQLSKFEVLVNFETHSTDFADSNLTIILCEVNFLIRSCEWAYCYLLILYCNLSSGQKEKQKNMYDTIFAHKI